MNSHAHIQNTLNHLLLQPYPIKIETEQQTTGSKAKTKPKFNQGEGLVQDIQQGFQKSVRVVK